MTRISRPPPAAAARSPSPPRSPRSRPPASRSRTRHEHPEAGSPLALGPDTNIQKPGHISVALDDPDTNIQKPGHVSISRRSATPDSGPRPSPPAVPPAILRPAWPAPPLQGADRVLDLLTEAIAAAPARCAYAEARHVATDDEERPRPQRPRRAGRQRQLRRHRRARARRRRLGLRRDARGRRAAGVRGRARPRAGDRRDAAGRAGGAARAGAAGARATGPAGFERDPFDVSLEDKLELLLAAEARAARRPADRAQRRRRARAGACARRSPRPRAPPARRSASRCGAAISVDRASTATSCRCARTRARTAARRACAGWEHVLGFDLAAHAPRVAAEAIELLTAPPCPAGRTTLVLGGEQLALQIHESIGHALELDRMLLGEAAYAGTSWVGPGDLGTLRYGSEQLNITADATLPGGLGSFGWDDEGVAAARTPLIEAGVLRAALSDRESAAAIGLDAVRRLRARRRLRAPADRADDERLDRARRRRHARRPRRRHRRRACTSRRTARGRSTTAACTSSSRTEVAREIRGGELGRLLRNPSYAGVTPRFWGGLDAVCSASEWRLWGLCNCGKGEPGQVMRVSHGAAPARFRDVQVGVA